MPCLSADPDPLIHQQLLQIYKNKSLTSAHINILHSIYKWETVLPIAACHRVLMEDIRQGNLVHACFADRFCNVLPVPLDFSAVAEVTMWLAVHGVVIAGLKCWGLWYWNGSFKNKTILPSNIFRINSGVASHCNIWHLLDLGRSENLCAVKMWWARPCPKRLSIKINTTDKG